MANHRINLEESEFPIVHVEKLAGAYGDGNHKTLQIQTIIKSGNGDYDISFIVLQKREVRGRFRSLDGAIEYYNMVR